MKKIIFAVAIAIAALTSCNKQNIETTTPEPIDGIEVGINFASMSGQFETRAFFDNVAQAEPWEKEIKKATIYVCGPDDKIIMRKSFSSDDISAQSTRIILPLEMEGKECTFYALVNRDHTDMGYRFNYGEGVETASLAEVAGLNSYFSLITKEASSPFPMAGKQSAVIQPRGTVTNVPIVVKRSYAKLAIKIVIDHAFKAKYGDGRLISSYIIIENAARFSTMFPNTGYTDINRQTLSQYSEMYDGEWCNLFYINDNSHIKGSKEMKMLIIATFDADGDALTNDDQIQVRWETTLKGSGDGEIKRNAYYRLELLVKGMNAIDDIRTSLITEEWETPITIPTEELN